MSETCSIAVFVGLNFASSQMIVRVCGSVSIGARLIVIEVEEVNPGFFSEESVSLDVLLKRCSTEC